MQFSTKPHTLPAYTLATDCLIWPVFEKNTLDNTARAHFGTCAGKIEAALKSGDLAEKAGSTLLLRDLPDCKTGRVLLMRVGAADKLDAKVLIKAWRETYKVLKGLGAVKAALCLTHVGVKGLDARQLAQLIVQETRAENYSFNAFKSKPEVHKSALKNLELWVSAEQLNASKHGLAQGVALANGMDLSKNLGNTPANVCTPTYLAKTAQTLGKEWKFKVEVLERKQLQALKMGSFLAVAQGSVEPPKFILMHYSNGGKAQPTVLVGKGITFDTGGISLKPGEGMDEMKYDMCGAASVLGAFRAAVELKLKINLIGIIPTCENMPAGNAIKPGDIVTSMSGQTIEILNTDAEGRLILCDALTYAERFKPACVVDMATLTGACIIALGHVNSGLFANNDQLAEELTAASQRARDGAWRLPLDEEYQEQLKSNFADMANIGGRPAGSITAASFLARYTKKYAWAHLDIAGTAWKSGAAKGATGRPVPLLLEFLSARAK